MQELRELENLVGDTARFAALPPQEQQERQAALTQTGEHLRSLLYLSSGTTRTLATSTQEVTAPFLLPEMVERLAGMLNYFMLYLTGPERKSLKVGAGCLVGRHDHVTHVKHHTCRGCPEIMATCCMPLVKAGTDLPTKMLQRGPNAVLCLSGQSSCVYTKHATVNEP